ncbi:MAG: ATP-binding cassette domain-containing protein [Clostridiales bacterium]|nr:ATP-binding cassette domain-containing protein [Clostridiales bacterium]
MIEVKDLVKRYGNHTAVDHLSFTVEDGQILGFLGPNGAGKSTTMNIITGYLGATEGKVLINGIDIAEEPLKGKKEIGYLPEIPPLYNDMRVKEYLMFVAELKSVPKKERRKMIEEVMDQTALTDMQNRLIRHLSKGYRQRVGLAGALIGYPKVIILDEPTVGLDPRQIMEIRDLIRKLGKKHTVILSSHIMQEVSAVCDEVLIINNGKLVARDTPEHIEKGMSSSAGLKIKAKGDADTLKETLEGLDGIQSVQVETGDNQTLLVNVACEDNGDSTLEMVSSALSQAHIIILGMEAVSVSLEDAFLKLVEENDAQEFSEEESVEDEDAVAYFSEEEDPSEEEESSEEESEEKEEPEGEEPDKNADETTESEEE